MSPEVAGVIFDLDGTLTAPGAISFDQLRTRIGMPSSGSILAWIAANARDSAEQAHMEALVWEEERLALDRMRLGGGFADLAATIQDRGASLRTAICTRNNGEALEAFDALLQRSGFPPSTELFQVQIARSHHSPHLDRRIENKPSHEPVHEIIRCWDLTRVYAPIVAHEHDQPSHRELLFVGDDIDDCLSARRAGVRSGWIRHGQPFSERPAEDRAEDRAEDPAEDQAEDTAEDPAEHPEMTRTADLRFSDLSEVATVLSRQLRSG